MGNAKAVAVAAGSMALASLVGAAAVRVQRKHCLQVIRTKGGIARVHMVDTVDGGPVRVLSEGGVFQSATYLGDRRFEPVFAYYRGFDAMFAGDPVPARPISRVLMLGGGGFAYPKHLLTTRKDVHMDVVELDTGIVRAARRWFYLDELEARLADSATAEGCSLTVYTGDGRAFLDGGRLRVLPPEGRGLAGIDGRAAGASEMRVPADGPSQRAMGPCQDPDGPSVRDAAGIARLVAPAGASAPITATSDAPDDSAPSRPASPAGLEAAAPARPVAPAPYDAIVNDAFTGCEPARCLATVEAARAAYARLAPGGLYLMNIVSRDEGRDVSFLQDEVATLSRVFAHVHVLQTTDETFGGEDNYLVIATDSEASFEGAIPFDADFPGRVLWDGSAA